MQKLLLFVFLSLILLLFDACKASQSAAATPNATSVESRAAAKPAATFVGTWATAVSGTPAGDVNFDLIFEQVDGKFKGYLMSEGTKTDLTDVKVEGNKATVNFYSTQFGVDVYFTAILNETGDAISGYVMDNFKLTGKRK